MKLKNETVAHFLANFKKSSVLSIVLAIILTHSCAYITLSLLSYRPSGRAYHSYYSTIISLIALAVLEIYVGNAAVFCRP